jgi:trehalose 6-phosphate phosphatase
MLRQPEAVVFDLDGVLVDTARLHARAWKKAFDRFFEDRGIDDEFDDVEDYRSHVDGRPRYEGVAAFLRARQIELPAGEPDDDPGFSTEAALGNLKNDLFHEVIDSEGVDLLDGAEELVEALAASGVSMAVVSSSRNAPLILPEELGRHIEVVLSGTDVEELGLPGKPAPDMFVEGARRIGVRPDAAAVIEDADVGVRAGRAGGFAIVIGIDPDGSSGLKTAGADVVVTGVAALPSDIGHWGDLIEPPLHAMGATELIIEQLAGNPAIFLDYDGTLTPIVDDPAEANIGDDERSILRRVARSAPLAIVSGRGLDDVKSHVAVEGLFYSGSHGFEIESTEGERSEKEEAAEAVPELDQAEAQLIEGAQDLPGVMIERKPYAIAVHTRRAESDQARKQAGELARDVVGRFDHLVLRGGKEIHELRPAFDWDKGSAIRQLLQLLAGDPVPLYIGDDETDEDAFRALRRLGGIGILVGTASAAETWADYTLRDPGEVLEFLAKIGGTLNR